MLTINGKPINTGATVRYKGQPCFIFAANPVSGYVSIITMDERREFKTVFPKDIGATWRP